MNYHPTVVDGEHTQLYPVQESGFDAVPVFHPMYPLSPHDLPSGSHRKTDRPIYYKQAVQIIKSTSNLINIDTCTPSMTIDRAQPSWDKPLLLLLLVHIIKR